MRILIFFFLLFSNLAHAQLFSWFSDDDKKKNREMLMANRAIQIEMTAAMNNMYNFNYDAAEKDFKWLTVKYPDHPIGYFLLGLNEWWKIVPDTKVEKYDAECERYMDKAIDLAEDIYDDDNKNKEAAFFLAASYAFKGRLHTERERWVKAAYVGKQAMKWLDKCRGFGDFSPELYMGDGLYNYYSKWIPENYPSLKPLLVFFKKGNKNAGISQLEYVSLNAFYTRMESRYFLIQIYNMEKQYQKAYNMARMMHNMYPENSFFHRYAASTAFTIGKSDEAEKYAKELLTNIENNKLGYEGTAGRYAAYIIGYINFNYNHNLEEAKKYYLKTIEFAKSTKALDSGYFLGANLALGKIAKSEGDFAQAMEYFKIVDNNSEKKSDTKKEAQKLIDETKKLMKKKK